MMGSGLIKQLGFEEEKGVTVEFSIKDKNILAFITFDLKKGGASELSKIGITANTENIDLDTLVKDFENNGITCK